VALLQNERRDRPQRWRRCPDRRAA